MSKTKQIKPCGCAVCNRSRQFEDLVRRKDFDRMAFCFRGLLNYAIELEYALGRSHLENERLSPSCRPQNYKLSEELWNQV